MTIPPLLDPDGTPPEAGPVRRPVITAFAAIQSVPDLRVR